MGTIRHRNVRVITLLVMTLAGSAAPAAAQTVIERTVPEAAVAPTRALPVQTASPFVDLGWTFQKDTRPGVFSRDNIWQATVGAEVAVSPSLSLTGGLTYTLVDRTTRIPVGDYQSDGLIGFIGASLNFLDVWTFQVSAGYGLSDVEQTRIFGDRVFSSAYTSISRFASATVFGTFFAGNLLVRPFTQLVYAATRDEAYLEATDVFNRSVLDTVGRSSIGAELAYPILVNDVLVAPVFRAAFLYDVNLPRDYTDRTAFELSAGLNLFFGDLTGGIRYSATVGREDYLSHGIRALVSYRF